ncbi:hypothetical protein GCM10027451_27960 [Geodermatophilus aquaeductus]|uniref:Transcriptional regulator, AbiEi antitoxin, Type IV TA system n=1 Tax=Geodermatophilus aquaeductus TaxID=1564161 RepID=A0A521F846_9ACTN|nr:type IV toxin-antitoxin system AbiEi family antitoxin domain-containing protein [Geodermatophilus aquaeductus]SMO92327.1 Transcriptional regulator, AbiEi antitoxin, Type IV TA system [Geodermatophilus aquaeductus]
MSTSTEGLTLLSDLASEQWGLLTSSQARQVGVTTQQLARLTHQGALDRLRHGVYRLAGAPADRRTELKAAWLSLAPELSVHERLSDPGVAVVSFQSAADLHALGDLEADTFNFSLAERKQTRDAQIRLHRRHLTPEEWTVIDGLPVTTVPVTVGDLAHAGVDGGHLAGVVRDAVLTQHADVDQIVTVLNPVAHRYGAQPGHGYQLLQQLLQQAGVPRSTRAVGQLLSGAPDQAAMEAAQQALATALRPSQALLEQALASLQPTKHSVQTAAAAALAPVTAKLQQMVAAAVAPVTSDLQRLLAQHLTSALSLPVDAPAISDQPVDPPDTVDHPIDPEAGTTPQAAGHSRHELPE